MAVRKILERLLEHGFGPGFVQRQEAVDDAHGVVFAGGAERAGNDQALVRADFFQGFVGDALE